MVVVKGARNEELVFNGYRVLLEKMKSSGDDW
jgi:hypothetical protein